MVKNLKIGSLAPEFKLEDKDGCCHTLAETSGKFVVLYFYPKDNTPGCTIEARAFNSTLATFKKRDVTIFGISGGTQKSKTSFCQKHGLKLTLLSDPDFTLCKAYGAYGTKSFMGVKFKGIRRMTFILDAQHRIVKIYDKVKVAKHAEEVLKDIDELG